MISFFKFRNKKSSLDAQISAIFSTMGQVFYDFGLVSDKLSWLAGRYQMPISPRGSAILVSGWLKVPVKTDLLPAGVFLSDLEDPRLLTALRIALSRNVETRMAPAAALPGLLFETSSKERYPAMFEFWYFIEIDVSYLRMIPRSVAAIPEPPFSMLLPVPFGQSVAGKFMWFDYPTDLIGMLVCGATRTGKSVFVKQVLSFLSSRYPPSYFTAYLADFKYGVEFGNFTSPHFLHFDDVQKFLETIQFESERRFNIIKLAGCLNVLQYNEAHPNSKLPLSLVVIDEFAMFKLKGAKNSIDLASALVAQTAGAGLYWMISTQRPSVDIITGSLKANLGARLSFSQATLVDYSVVFGEGFTMFTGPLGCPGRFGALVQDQIFEAQSPYFV